MKSHRPVICKVLTAALAGMLTPGLAGAVEDLSLDELVDDVSLEDLANIVVTDTKVAQSRNSVTQNIVVLLGDEEDRHPAPQRNLAERLGHVSGQFVNVLSRNDANWGSYAGLGPKYNSYLLDGLPIDSFVEPMSLDPWAFERTEAHKGPASVLYGNYLSMDFAGNEAPLAGTTNLILKDKVEETKTRLQASYGSYHTAALRAYHQGSQGNLDYFVGASGEDSDYSQYGNANSWLQTVEDPDYRKSKIYGKLSYAFGRDDHRLSLFAHHSGHDGDMGRPNRDFDHHYELFNLVYNNRLNDHLHLQAKLGERRYQRQFSNDNFPASLAFTGSDATEQRIRPLDLALSIEHWNNALLTVGVDYQTVDYSTTAGAVDGLQRLTNDVEGSSQGFYVQEKVQLGDWVLRAGVRHYNIEHDYNILGALTPDTAGREWRDDLWSIGARYNIAETLSIYGNAGSSFMAPAAKQIGGTVADPNTDSGQLANPALDAESGVGRDLGIAWQPLPSLELGARLFQNQVSSAIVDNVVRAIPSQALASNAGELRANGIELDLRHSPTDSLSWFTNLTLNRSRAKQPANADEDGAEIPFVPDLVANVGLWWDGPGAVRISSYYQWVGRYYDSTAQSSRIALGSYGLLNLRADKPLWSSSGQELRLFVELNNLTDREPELPFGFRDPGFSGQVGVDLRF